MIEIEIYTDKHKQTVVDLVLFIQQKEFGVPVTYQDQPDLMDISGYFQKGNGNFWVALNQGKLIGCIALIDCGEFGVIRKMFVEQSYRGKELGVAKFLLNTLESWAGVCNIKKLFLGTVEMLKAAHRFYEKNGYTEISVEDTPTTFPRMAVDTKFYRKDLLKLGTVINTA